MYSILFFFRKAKPALWQIIKITILLPVYAYTCYLQFFERIKKRSFYEHTCESDAKIPFKNQILMNAMIDSLVK